jgi:phosphomannomutase
MQTRIGSPYIIDAMNCEIERNPDSKVAGWECNGGFLIGSDWTINDSFLRSLPTRDAVLPLISVLLLAVKDNMAVSELITSRLPKRYTHADVIGDKTPGCEIYTAEMGKTIIKMLSPEDNDVFQVDFTIEGIKTNGTDYSTSSDHNLNRIKERLGSYFLSERGFTDITSINFIDGVRIVFSNGDVAHLRPSGNAPEFRIYATADTQEEANLIVEKRYEIVPDIISDIIKKEGKE